MRSKSFKLSDIELYAPSGCRLSSPEQVPVYHRKRPLEFPAARTDGEYILMLPEELHMIIEHSGAEILPVVAKITNGNGGDQQCELTSFNIAEFKIHDS